MSDIKLKETLLRYVEEEVNSGNKSYNQFVRFSKTLGLLPINYSWYLGFHVFFKDLEPLFRAKQSVNGYITLSPLTKEAYFSAEEQSLLWRVQRDLNTSIIKKDYYLTVNKETYQGICSLLEWYRDYSYTNTGLIFKLYCLFKSLHPKSRKRESQYWFPSKHKGLAQRKEFIDFVITNYCDQIC